MLNPEYEGVFWVHQSIERFFGQVGDRVKEVLQPLGNRRFWANFVEPKMIGVYTILYGDIRWMISLRDTNILGTAEGAGIMALGAVIFYRFNRPKWWKLIP